MEKIKMKTNNNDRERAISIPAEHMASVDSMKFPCIALPMRSFYWTGWAITYQLI